MLSRLYYIDIVYMVASGYYPVCERVGAAAKNKKPVLGINLGNLGFLTEAPINKLEHLLKEFFDYVLFYQLRLNSIDLENFSQINNYYHV